MKPARWTSHALRNLADREIERDEVNEVLARYETDALVITPCDQRIRESDEIKPGVITDFGYDGGIVRFEELRASQVVEKTSGMQLAFAA